MVVVVAIVVVVVGAVVVGAAVVVVAGAAVVIDAIGPGGDASSVLSEHATQTIRIAAKTAQLRTGRA